MKNGEFEVALYSGWGVVPHVRNFGDALCHRGGVQLLAGQGISNIVDIRSSIEPINEPWEKPLVVGGGTVVPTLFEPWIGTGLKVADPIIIFGSGVLSPEELKIKNIPSIDKTPYDRAHVAGVRGPISTEYYQAHFGKTVDYVGDLGFAEAHEAPRLNEHGDVLFFLVESDAKVCRTDATQHDILKTYKDIVTSPQLDNRQTTLCLTDQNAQQEELFRAQDYFDNRVQIQSLDDFVDTVQGASFVFTERLHPAIIAANAGVPFLYVQTTSKSRDLESLLRDQRDASSIQKSFVELDGEKRVDLPRRYEELQGDTELPGTLIYAANSIKERLEAGAEQVAARL